MVIVAAAVAAAAFVVVAAAAVTFAVAVQNWSLQVVEVNIVRLSVVQPIEVLTVHSYSLHCSIC